MDISKVQINVVRSDGKEFLIDNQSWKITSDGLDGFDFITPTISTEANAFGDGSVVQSIHIGEKDRTVKCRYQGTLQEKASQRQFVRNFLNPKYTYKVVVDYMEEKKYCEGSLYTMSCPTENIYKDLTLQFTILSTQPYLLSYDDFNKNIASVEGGLEFNFEIPEEGVEFGTYSFAKEIEIDNQGDVETYCKAIFTAKGTVINPMLKKDDVYIKIIDTMNAGDVIEMDLVSKPVHITKNGKNIIGKTDRSSSFNEMLFSVGQNVISFDADNGDNLLDVVILYNERFLGM